jgi:hypothetical protein
MKGLCPVSFAESDTGAGALDFMLPPTAALDFSCACEEGEIDPVALLVKAREYLIAEKGLAFANDMIPLPAIDGARQTLWDANEALKTLDAIEAEQIVEQESEDEAPEDVPYVDPYPIYSYQESPATPTTQEKKRAMGMTKTKTKKHSSEDDFLVDKPLHGDTSVLDEMDEYDRFDEEDEDEEEEEDVAPPKKSKAKSKAQDYSEIGYQLRRDMERRLRALEADFSEKLKGLESELEAQANDFSEQKEDLERQLAEQHLQALAQQCEVESKFLEFEEAKEQNRLEGIASFVEEILEEGVHPHLVGEVSLEFAETEDGQPITWELADFMATLDDAQLEFAENFIRGFAGALSESRAAVDYSERSAAPTYVPAPKDPVADLGVKLPSSASVSPQAQAEAQMLVDFAEANGYDLNDKEQFKQAYKRLRKGGI